MLRDAILLQAVLLSACAGDIVREEGNLAHTAESQEIQAEAQQRAQDPARAALVLDAPPLTRVYQRFFGVTDAIFTPQQRNNNDATARQKEVRQQHVLLCMAVGQDTRVYLR